jgi:plasmid replication initiation protein
MKDIQNNQLVVKSNRLIEASYRLSLNEQRIILFAISRVRRDRELHLDDVFEVHASDLVSFFGVDPKTAYAELIDVSKTLFNRHVTLDNPYPNDPRVKTLLTRWVSSIAYLPENGCIRLRFAQDVLPFLSVLETQFTRYKLEAVGKMTSVYAVRLYELLIQWGGVGKREIEIDWLKQRFQIEDKYSAIKDLKKYVIDAAVNQINKYSDISVTYNQRKTGRAVTHFIFTFEAKNKAVSTTEKSSNSKKKLTASEKDMIFGVSKSEIEKLARPGESYEDAAARIKKTNVL